MTHRIDWNYIEEIDLQKVNFSWTGRSRVLFLEEALKSHLSGYISCVTIASFRASRVLIYPVDNDNEFH